MKIEKIKNQSSPRLLLFFDGWAAPPELFRNIEPEMDSDYWIVSDYRDLSFPESLSSYAEVDVVAWSLGVWVAERIGSTCHARWNKCVAVNGTYCPVSDALGIPEKIFQGTMEQLSDDGMRRFERRICGDRNTWASYRAFPPRPLSEITDELRFLYHEITAGEKGSSFSWSKAWIGTGDRIFPPENQKRAWLERNVLYAEIESPHYCFHTTRQWNEWLER